MKNNKFLLLLIFLLVGCKPQYNLYFTDEEIIEDFSIELPNTPDNEKIVNNDYYPLFANFDILYEKEVEMINDSLVMNLKYTYLPDEYYNSNILYQCFHNKELDLVNDNYYYLKLSEFYPCVTASEFDINIKTKNKVLMNNADSVNGDTYTWHVTEDNKENLLIEIKIAKGKSARDNSYIGYILVGIAVIVIVVFIRLFIARKNSRDDF